MMLLLPLSVKLTNARPGFPPYVFLTWGTSKTDPLITQQFTPGGCRVSEYFSGRSCGVFSWDYHFTGTQAVPATGQDDLPAFRADCIRQTEWAIKLEAEAELRRKSSYDPKPHKRRRRQTEVACG
ncbi:MAG: hypothetical protein ACH37Z_14950 [Anaerolineae bacterium]